MSEAGSEPDVIGPKADIGTHAAWLAGRNWPTLSRIGPAYILPDGRPPPGPRNKRLVESNGELLERRVT